MTSLPRPPLLFAKNDLRIHLFVYLAVNALLVAIWVITGWGQPFPLGFFWPLFPNSSVDASGFASDPMPYLSSRQPAQVGSRGLLPPPVKLERSRA